MGTKEPCRCSRQRSQQCVLTHGRRCWTHNSTSGWPMCAVTITYTVTLRSHTNEHTTHSSGYQRPPLGLPVTAGTLLADQSCRSRWRAAGGEQHGSPAPGRNHTTHSTVCAQPQATDKATSSSDHHDEVAGRGMHGLVLKRVKGASGGSAAADCGSSADSATPRTTNLTPPLSCCMDAGCPRHS